MPGGRPRKMSSVSTGKIGKEARAEREIQESKLKLGRDDLKPPSFLDFDGQKEFKRVVKEAKKVDILDNLDLTILAVYAHAWEQYTKCAAYVQEHGVTETRVNQYGEYETVSPWVSAQEKYAKQIMQCSTKLGLATTDRLKLIVPTKEEEQPINRYLKYAK